MYVDVNKEGKPHPNPLQGARGLRHRGMFSIVSHRIHRRHGIFLNSFYVNTIYTRIRRNEVRWPKGKAICTCCACAASRAFSFLEHESHKYHEYLHVQACAGQDSRWLNDDDNDDVDEDGLLSKLSYLIKR